ncbi:RNA-binding protein [Candidatus Woesearchaeota archaeon]|nr:RNA-binding protein [Candidatus Woesearchaeota archaeon]
MDVSCISCKKRMANVKGAARFLCPSCGSYELVRCAHCRETAARYRCPSCSFSGPN